MRKDYITKILEGIVSKNISTMPQSLKFAYKKKIIEDLLISNSDTFSSITLDVANNLSYKPIDPNSIVVYKESTTTYYQRYSDWICNATDGTITFLSTGSIEAGTNIVVEYKYYKAVGEMAAADILTALLTVDGASSGLDADLLDGQEGSYYTNYADDAETAAKDYADTKKILFQFVLVKKGDLAVGTDVSLMPIPAYCAGIIKEVYIYVKTAPTGSSIIVDVNKNGTTIFTTQSKRPEIAISSNSGTSDEPDVTSFVKNDLFTIDIDQVGSTIAGADLIVLVRGEQVIS